MGKKTGNPMGRPRGAKAKKPLSNGYITEEQIYLYVPKDTVPRSHLDRFLELCDNMIITLNPPTVTNPEVEEIAQYYRDILTADDLYRTISDPALEGAVDSTLVKKLENFNKQIEKRKENLQIRAKDKSDSRNLTKQKTMMDLLGEVDEDLIRIEIDKYKDTMQALNDSGKYTDPLQYMEERAPNSYIPTEEVDEG